MLLSTFDEILLINNLNNAQYQLCVNLISHLNFTENLCYIQTSAVLVCWLYWRTNTSCC